MAGDVNDEGNDQDGGIGGEVTGLVEGRLNGGELGLRLLGGHTDAQAAEGHEIVIAIVA